MGWLSDLPMETLPHTFNHYKLINNFQVFVVEPDRVRPNIIINLHNYYRGVPIYIIEKIVYKVDKL